MKHPVDRFAQTNPAFVASVTRWLCEGYSAERKRVHSFVGLHPIIALLAIALVTPDGIRTTLPRIATAKLALLLREHSEWRMGLADAARALVLPFWAGVRFGVATRCLLLQDARLFADGTTKAPTSSNTIDLRRRATVMGRLIGKEPDDASVLSLFNITVSS